MRSPGQPFDVRAALSAELRAAQAALIDAPVDAKAVHQVRVHLKRARALALVGADAAPGLQALFDESARNAMRALAQARTFAALADTSRDASAKARKRAARALVTAAEGLEAALRSAPATDYESINGVLRDLLALAQVWPEVSARQIVRGCRDVARRAKRARVRALADDASPKTRHAWRKRESDRRHVMMVMDDAWPRRCGLGKSTRTVAALGRERDVHLLINRIEKAPALAGGEADAKRALKALRRRQRKFRRRANEAGAALRL